jgi:hypothetical protein
LRCVLSRNSIAAIATLCLAVAACGGGAESSSDTESTPSAPLNTQPSGVIASTTVAVDAPAPTTSEAVEMTAPVETIALSADECPNGEWLIDPSGIGPFDLFGSSDDVTLTGEGSFLATFADGRYTIATDDFSLDLLTSTSEIVMDVTGSTSGALVIGTEMLTFDEASFDMTADVTIDGAEVPGEFIEEAFHQTFGSATVPYTCNDDGTVTITYDTPTGPATAVHEPA